VSGRRELTTVDIDVVETNSELERKAHELFGEKSKNHERARVLSRSCPARLATASRRFRGSLSAIGG
jgi:hypothetical protein